MMKQQNAQKLKCASAASVKDEKDEPEREKEQTLDVLNSYFFPVRFDLLFVSFIQYIEKKKTRVSNARFTLFTNTKPVYDYKAVMANSKESG